MLDLKAIIEALAEFFKGIEARKRAFVWAYYGAPGGILIFLLLWVGSRDFSNMPTHFVSVASLRTEINVDKQTARTGPFDGIVLVGSPIDSEFRVPWTSQEKRRVWTSLSAEDLLSNEDRLRAGASAFQLRLPLFGVEEPVVIVAEGKLPDHLELLGKRIATERFQLKGLRSHALMMCSLISAVFGFGVTLSSGAIRGTLLAKDTSGKESAGENKN